MNQHIINGSKIEVDSGSSKLGIIVTFGAITMLFVTLLASAGSMIIQDLGHIYLTTFNKIVVFAIASLLILSSIFFESSFNCWKSGETKDARWYLVSSIITALIFIFGQLMLYQQLVIKGFTASTNVVAGMIYLIGGMHAIHLLSGMGFLIWLLYQILNENRLKMIRFRLIGWYWHFLTILWFALLTILIIII
mgnify:CR=1 FL=1